ncbi:type III secretion system translocon subunit SctE [Aeromonas veronii]
MNSIIEPRYGRSSTCDNQQGLCKLMDTTMQQVGAGAFDSITLPRQKHERQRELLHVPPPPRQSVTLSMAEGALNRIMQTFGPKTEGKPIRLADIERTPMDAMSLAAALLGVKALGDNANLKSLALEIRTHGAENLRLLQNEELRKQIDKAIEDQQKAHKAGIFAAVVDWIISAAEIVSGVVKLVVGDVAGGMMDLGAGSAGLVKALCETLALIDTANADKYKEIANIAGKVQLSFEIAGMMVDLVSVGRGVMAAKSMAKTTETVMNKGASELLENTLKQASSQVGKEVAQEVIQGLAKQVASEVAEELAEQIARNIAEQSTRFLGQGHLLEAFSKQAIERMVTAAVEKVAKKALESGVKSAANELTKEVMKEVQKAVIHAAIHASITSTENIIKAGTRGGMQGANGVFQGEVTKERAELQKVVQELINENYFMQSLLDEFEKIKKRAKEDIGNLMSGASQALSAGSDAQLKTGAMLSRIAASIA